MKLLNIEIQGFGSYHSAQALSFEHMAPGLYHVAGNNKLHPRLEGNAVGKSKLFEAVCWCLFGKTSRNLKAGTVRGWYTKEDCIVALTVQTRKDRLEIMRAWSPNVLAVSVNGTTTKPIEQSELEQLLGINFDAFLFSYYHAQFTPKFLDLAPSTQLDLYTQATKLDFWEEASTFAGKAATATREELQKAKELLAGAKEKVASYKAFSYKKEEAEWAAQQAKKEHDLAISLRHEQKRVDTWRAALEQAKKKLAQAKDFSQAVAEAQAHARHQQLALNTAEQELTKIERKKEGACPSCGQRITKQHLDKEKTRLQLLWESIGKEVKAAGKQLKELLAQQEKIRPLEVDVAESTANLRVAEKDTITLTQQAQNLKQETNPYTAKQAHLEKELAEARQVLTEAEKDRAKLEKEEHSLTYWNGGFREIRLALIKESLAQLNIEANRALASSGLPDWGLEFDVERETKGGKISRGFTTVVHAPELTMPVPWEAWSGGESQRLRIAGTIGMAGLICSQLGIIPNIEFWDEPSTWLNAEGISDLLDSLADRAMEEKKVILLADHRVLHHGKFAGTLLITKDAQGSHIERILR